MHITRCNDRLMKFFSETHDLLVDFNQIVIRCNRRIFITDKEGIVTESIDNLAEKGKVKLGGMEWTARSANGEKIEKDAVIVVKEVSGVKLIVLEKGRM